MDIFVGLVFVVLTYIVFTKIPAPAVLLTWMFTGIAGFLYLIGSIESGMVYLTFIILLIVMMISTVIQKNRW